MEAALRSRQEVFSAVTLGKSDKWYLQELIRALGDFYDTMVIEKDDELLLRFVRYTDYDIEKAVKFVHASDKFIRDQEHLFRIPFKEITHHWDHPAVLVFRQRDPEGRKVILFKAKYYDPDEVDIDHAIVGGLYGMDELMKSVKSQKNGFIFIGDYTGVGYMRAAYILSKITHQHILLAIKAYQYTFPVKIVASYSVNVPLVGAALYNSFKYLIRKKLRDRIHVIYSGPKALHKYFPKDFLPQSLEGDVPDELCQDTEFFQRLKKKQCRFPQFQPS